MELLHVVVEKPVVADGNDAPIVGASEIQHDISAPPVAARVDGAVDHLSCVSGDAALAAGEPERHHYGIEIRNNLPERHVARLIVGGRHRAMIADQGRVSPPDISTQVHRPCEERHCELVEAAA
jgi:hypothetical protein